MKASTLLPALILAISGFLPASLNAQVAIYSLRFEKTGPNVNYQSWSEGFAVVPLEGGLSSLILQLESGLSREFIEATELGEYYVATQNGVNKGVLANAESDGTPINFLTLVGNLDTTVKASSPGVTLTARVPDSMEGYILTADPLGSTLFEVGENNTGSAGGSEMKASLDEVRTMEANTQGQTVEEAIDALIEELVEDGFIQIDTTDEEDTEVDATSSDTDA